VNTKFRTLVGGTALAAGLLFLSGAAAAPEQPKDTYKKLAEGDIKLLKERLKTLAESPEDPNIKGHYRTARSLSMLLAYYGEATGDKELRDQALKVAEELEKIKKAAFTPTAKRAMDGSNDAIAKGGKAALALAGKLAFRPGAKPLSPTPLYTLHKIDLEEIMGAYRQGFNKEAEKHFGGLGMEKAIKDAVKKEEPVKLDPAAAELIGARSAVIGEFTLHMPNDAATAKPADKAQWEKWSKEMIDLSQQLTAEASKGKAADEKVTLKLLKALDSKCFQCHEEYRDK
jgi:hypothetical protein